jgi:hypothetical protein
VDRPEEPSDRPAWEPPAGSAGYQPPAGGYEAPSTGYRPPAQQQRTPGNAVASLVLGILGIILCPLICSVLAIIFGRQAKDEIERDPSLGGAGMAQAGYILGLVGLGLFALGLVFWVVVIAAA